jgi:RNA polymerase sigma-70 factor (ECF subfamily)
MSDTGLENNNEQFVKLFLANQASIYAFILSILPNRSDADDILQDTGLVLCQRFGEFRPDSNFFAWACRIAHYKVLDHSKRLARSPVHFDDRLIEAFVEDSIASADERDDEFAALLRCMQKLSARDRELLDRCYQPKVSTRTVAEELNRPADTIYKRLRRIRTTLFECVTRSLAREARS